MSSEWTTLSQINFLIHRRLMEFLDRAATDLGQLSAVHGPEHERALQDVTAAREMYNAWNSLIRFNAREDPAITGPQQFKVCDLLDWIAAELNIARVPDCEDQEVLQGNLATVQEALIALKSCTQTLGPRAHIVVQRHERGFWVRVRYGKPANPPATLGELMAGLRSNWRLETAAFELACAHDFLAMNDMELFFTLPDQHCELSFFLPFSRQRGKGPSARDKVKTMLDSYNASETYEVITDYD
jgi:hypothetical protein